MCQLNCSLVVIFHGSSDIFAREMLYDSVSSGVHGGEGGGVKDKPVQSDQGGSSLVGPE